MSDHEKEEPVVPETTEQENVEAEEMETPVEEAEVREEEAVEVVEDWRDKYMRVLAELDNLRKRTDRERVQQRQYASEGLMRDALECALSAEGDAASIREGVELALNDAFRILGDKGFEKIETEGQPFDPRWHEAMGMVPAEGDQAPGTIVTELRSGYRLRDRVLRASRVQIAMAIAQAAPAEDDQAESADEQEGE